MSNGVVQVLAEHKIKTRKGKRRKLGKANAKSILAVLTEAGYTTEAGEPTAELPDRRVHAVGEGGREIVRYDRAGKWWVEGPMGRKQLTLSQAAGLAASWEQQGGKVRLNVPGGTAFDRAVLRARSAYKS